MITFNIQARNKNYLMSQKPHSGNCWTGEVEDALVLTIEQARALVESWHGYLNIVIAVSAEPITDAQFKRELFCVQGGKWFDYPGRKDS